MASAEPSPLTAEGIERRQEVLLRAAELFAAKGFDGTSINDISAVTTLKKASLYHYFPSKQTILAEILDSGIDQLLADAAEASRIEDPVQRIEALLGAHLTNFRDKLPQVIVFLLERNVLEKGAEATYLERRKAYDELYVEAIREGQRQGVFRDDDPVVLTYAVLGMVNWMVQWYDPNGRLSLEEITAIMQRSAISAISR